VQHTFILGRRLGALAFGLVMVTVTAALQAQVQRSGGTANSQLTQQFQQIVTERAQLQAENDKLKKQVTDLQKQLDAGKQQLAASKTSAAGAAAQLQAAQSAGQSSAQQLEQSKARLQELVGRFRDTAVTLRGVEAERAQLEQQLNQAKASFDQCAERNYALYQVDNEVLDKYEHQGAWSYAARAEPFTRLKRTQIENLVDEYRQRAEELRVQKAAGTGPASSGAPTPVQFAAPSQPTQTDSAH
jgi:chromosome segregation ATPase